MLRIMANGIRPSSSVSVFVLCFENKAARKIISAIFMISTGWKDSGPIFSHNFANVP